MADYGPRMGEVFAPMPRPDPRTNLRAAQNGALWPPPPTPYEGWKPQPMTPEQQRWLDVGLTPPPQWPSPSQEQQPAPPMAGMKDMAGSGAITDQDMAGLIKLLGAGR